ncbi:citrate lyase holo-[acyl-carrier protein] synthase [Vibrio albus]|uniref:citrate lyase holo-[acyl-carrier protein] synthase n=1 Tax=Vibrio albus TaxID=2200953 RepID=A0A2U3B6A9_9VIBR|nr:citrate lyase holo-[acyl-carrier protein] synthase [Vibrio albus]PWI32331.1 citrate lyase holo-[acyl-carrier protein] synthase [Vibrio albus]
MQYTATLYDEHQQSLERVKRQQRLLAQHALPLVIVNTNLPKALAHNSYAKEIYEITFESVIEKIQELNTRIIDREITLSKSGNEATLVITGIASSELKRAMIQIEKYHPLGMLMNIDVINPEGKAISRSASQLEARKCLLCECAASYCATNNSHTAAELEARILELFDAYFEKDAVA